jgi:hypothetical protein
MGAISAKNELVGRCTPILLSGSGMQCVVAYCSCGRINEETLAKNTRQRVRAAREVSETTKKKAVLNGVRPSCKEF